MKYFLKNLEKNETKYAEVTLAELQKHLEHYEFVDDCRPLCLTKMTHEEMYFTIEVYEC